MDSDVSTDQGSLPIHGIRDVGLTADRKQHDWSTLAEAPEVNTLPADPVTSYNIPVWWKTLQCRWNFEDIYHTPVICTSGLHCYFLLSFNVEIAVFELAIPGLHFAVAKQQIL